MTFMLSNINSTLTKQVGLVTLFNVLANIVRIPQKTIQFFPHSIDTLFVSRLILYSVVHANSVIFPQGLCINYCHDTNLGLTVIVFH